jgi:hypothetical protein
MKGKGKRTPSQGLAEEMAYATSPLLYRGGGWRTPPPSRHFPGRGGVCHFPVGFWRRGKAGVRHLPGTGGGGGVRHPRLLTSSGRRHGVRHPSPPTSPGEVAYATFLSVPGGEGWRTPSPGGPAKEVAYATPPLASFGGGSGVRHLLPATGPGEVAYAILWGDSHAQSRHAGDPPRPARRAPER